MIFTAAWVGVGVKVLRLNSHPSPPFTRHLASNDFFQPISYTVVLLVFGLMNLGPGTQSFGLVLEHLSLDNKCG